MSPDDMAKDLFEALGKVGVAQIRLCIKAGAWLRWRGLGVWGGIRRMCAASAWTGSHLQQDLEPLLVLIHTSGVGLQMS